jgi:hypothetical protein
MVKTVLSLLIGLLMLGSLASCMDDPINFEEAVPLNIFRPNSMGFRFVDYVPGSPTGSVKVYWTNSSGDAQPNFGGYVARILTFDSVTTETGVKIERSTIVAQQIVPKTTQQVVFENVPVGEKYLFAVWGMRNPDPEKPDSLILSRDSAAPTKQVIFDPRPVENPTVIRAASISANQVLLQWESPATDNQGNILSYAVYYRDPSKLNDSGRVATSLIKSDTGAGRSNSLVVPVTASAVGSGASSVKEYEFWIKAIRTDSTQFQTDTTVIRWSGGESIRLGDSLSTNGLHLGQALFFGNLNGRYSAKEVTVDDASANLKIEDAGDNILITGLNGTKFYSVYHGSTTLEVAKFSQPLGSSDYNESTLSLPKATPEGGWIIYAKLFGRSNEVARILLSGTGQSVVTPSNTINIDLIFQPKTTGADPLPYF